MTTELPQRKEPAHPTPVERHNEPVVLFVTVCTSDQGVNLACEPMHRALVAAWELANAWRVGWYMIMPDHVHLFCVPGTRPAANVKKWAGYWKGLVSRGLAGYGPLGEMPGPAPGGRISTPTGSIWQRDCWDTQMRNCDHYVEKRSYVAMNPVRRGLVSRPEDWPWQGEVHGIRW